MDEHPTSIGKYDLEQFLGGGMSRVYRAKDRLLGRTVCIKILTHEGAADSEVRHRFLQEARMAGNFCHDNVVSVYDFGEDHGNPFLVMEYLRGETLRMRMEQGRLGDVRTILQMALQLARALECVHAQGIIHRDIKPDNVHVSAQGTVKLMDFGIAKTHDLHITQAGFILGTPHYMAPEQIRGEEITASIDVYAFGVLLYELLGGQKPYRAETPEAIFYAILNQTPETGLLSGRAVPAAAQSLLLRCMSKRAEDRPANFTEIATSLEEMLSAPATPTFESAPTPPKKTNTAWVAAAGLASLLAVVAIVMVVRSRTAVAAVINTPTGVMVLVPGGDFLSGPTRQRKAVPGFYIDKTEVSNGAYNAFCRATGCLPASGDVDDPAVRITVSDARQFAHWASKRLPTADEWEKAARGSDGRMFPWGDARDSKLANLSSAAAERVDSYPLGASPYGVLQMAGNVWEMVEGSVVPSAADAARLAKALLPPPTLSEPWITMRGGGFHSGIEAAVSWEFAKIPARLSGRDIGFRCVKDTSR